MTNPADRNELLAENVADVLTNGPGLRRGRNRWIEARDLRGYVLVGGLGAMGVGTMWMDERTEETVYADGSRTPPDSEDPTYADAPIGVRTCGAHAPSSYRACAEPYGHEGQHRVPEVVLPEEEWAGPAGPGVFGGVRFDA